MKLMPMLLIAFFSTIGFCNITADNEYLLNHSLSGQAQKAQLGTLVKQTSGMLIARYSYALQGGSTAADIKLVTNLNLPKSYAVLPKGAIIRSVFIDPITPLTKASGAPTTAVKLQSAGDLLASTVLTGTTGLGVAHFVAGVPQGGSTTTYIRLTAARTVILNVGPVTQGSAPLTAGKFNVYITYELGDSTN